MSIQAHAFFTLNPSFVEPELILQQSQVSGYRDLLADGGNIRVRLAEDDLLVYMRALNLRTKMAASNTSFQELPGVDVQATYFSTPTYLFKSRAQWDHHDVAAGGRWGFAVPEAYRLGMRQGHFQLARDAGLHGMNPQNGEGFLNAPGATLINLPPDPFGNSTVTTYDNGAMAFFLAQTVILGIKTRTNNLGIPRKFTVLGPQRTLGSFQYNIVQLVQFQRQGAGSTSTVGTLKEIMKNNGDDLIWVYDDTLIGAGAGGTDAVIVGMPEVASPTTDGTNTNIFASLTPHNSVCLTQYADMAAPREIISPMAGGATDMMTEWRNTSGWAVRPVALTIVSMPYP